MSPGVSESTPIEFEYHGRKIAGQRWGDQSQPPMLALASPPS